MSRIDRLTRRMLTNRYLVEWSVCQFMRNGCHPQSSCIHARSKFSDYELGRFLPSSSSSIGAHTSSTTYSKSKILYCAVLYMMWQEVEAGNRRKNILFPRSWALELRRRKKSQIRYDNVPKSSRRCGGYTSSTDR